MQYIGKFWLLGCCKTNDLLMRLTLQSKNFGKAKANKEFDHIKSLLQIELTESH